MKYASLYVSTAIAIAIPATAMAHPPMPPMGSTVHPMIRPVVTPAPVIRTVTTGNVSNTTNGTGTFTQTKTVSGNTTTYDTVDHFQNGKTTTNVATYTQTGANTYSVNDVYMANGKVRDTIETKTLTSTGYDLSGKVYTSGGTYQVQGMDTTKSGYNVLNETLTTTHGGTEQLTYDYLHSGNASATQETGTGFKTINFASLTTTGPSVTSKTGVTTVDGPFNWASSSSTQNGTTTTTTARAYGDGAAIASEQSVTHNTGGTTTVDGASTTHASNGKVYSSTYDETYTPAGTGTQNISGTFTQSNGPKGLNSPVNGTVTGTQTQTSYGTATALTYTDQYGDHRTADTQTLKAGDATFNVNTGTTFTGAANNSDGLIVQ